MKQYTAAMATYYSDEWHIDYGTESTRMNEQDAIAAGHALAALGAFVLYTMYVDGERKAMMIEEDKKLKEIRK